MCEPPNCKTNYIMYEAPPDSVGKQNIGSPELHKTKTEAAATTTMPLYEAP